MAKIPVGCSRDNLNYLLDVMDVPSGKACNCVCPSCRAPLIARHCNGHRESHFAHDPAYESEYNYSECILSFHVALKLMLKQIMATSTEIFLPEYEVIEPYSDETITVTKERMLKFDCIGIDINGFDAVIRVNKYRLAIIITYPGRQVTHNTNCSGIHGILEIDLDLMQRSSLAPKVSWSEALSGSLIRKTQSKRWVWHVNTDPLLKEAKEKFMQLQADERGFIKESISRRRAEYAEVKAKPLMVNVYRCYECIKDYSTQDAMERCPKCNTKLLVTSIDPKYFQR
ncbi:hypothetical protein ACRWQL_00475 (plasmid) [Shewanella sp. HL-SH4]|uniref:hypothetical protein n=1 Tax=Shewanella sp. HL-SH4 TaxID=3436240 RepID=UPI003EBCE3DD